MEFILQINLSKSSNHMKIVIFVIYEELENTNYVETNSKKNKFKKK